MRHLRTCTLLRSGTGGTRDRTGGRLNAASAVWQVVSEGNRRAARSFRGSFCRRASRRSYGKRTRRSSEILATRRRGSIYPGLRGTLMIQHKPLAAPEFAAWNAAALRALTAARPEAVAEALEAALRLVLDFDVAVFAALHRDAPPSAPYYGGAQEPSPAYHDGPYLLDPFYNRFLAGKTEGCFRLSELAPEGFLRSEYFSSYYRHLDIGDELGLLTALGSGSVAHVSIMRRRGRPRFTRRDHHWLAAAAPLAREAVRRMKEVQSPVTNDRLA